MLVTSKLVRVASMCIYDIGSRSELVLGYLFFQGQQIRPFTMIHDSMVMMMMMMMAVAVMVMVMVIMVTITGQ